MSPRSLVDRMESAAPPDPGLILRLLFFDYLILAFQGSVIGHLQTPWFTCDLTRLAVTLVGFRHGVSVGAIHGFGLGWAGGALMAEPTGIPILVALLIGALAGAARENFAIEIRAVRIGLAIGLIALAAVMEIVLMLLVWQRFPTVLPLSLLIYMLLGPLVDVLAERPEDGMSDGEKLIPGQSTPAVRPHLLEKKLDCDGVVRPRK